MNFYDYTIMSSFKRDNFICFEGLDLNSLDRVKRYLQFPLRKEVAVRFRKPCSWLIASNQLVGTTCLALFTNVYSLILYLNNCTFFVFQISVADFVVNLYSLILNDWYSDQSIKCINLSSSPIVSISPPMVLLPSCEWREGPRSPLLPPPLTQGRWQRRGGWWIENTIKY